MIYPKDTIIKEDKVCKTNNKNKNNDGESIISDELNRLDNNINTLERDYVLFKNDINNNLKNLTENVILLTKNIDKMYEIEKKLLDQSHNDKMQEEKINHIEKTHMEKISNIEKKIDWITKLFISTVLVIGLKVVYDVKTDTKQIVYINEKEKSK